MEYTEFVERVEDRIKATRPGETENAIVATLDTLGERLSGGEASDVAARLPEELAAPLRRASGDAEGFSLEEFFRRVALKEDVDVETASAHAAAVMAVLGEAIDEGELQDVREQLPQGFYHLLE